MHSKEIDECRNDTDIKKTNLIYGMVFCNSKGWFCLENKITKNIWQIAETITISFPKGSFWPVLSVFCNFLGFVLKMKIAEII